MAAVTQSSEPTLMGSSSERTNRPGSYDSGQA